MNFDHVFKVSKEFEKDTFLRELIIKLGTLNETPVDVVDAEFQEVKESVKEVVVCTAHVQGTCTASVGYDRQEPYTDYETYREKVGDHYITRQRAVVKYRTVTDWSPYQTSYSGDATCAAFNSEDQGFGDHDIVEAIKTANIDSITDGGDAVVNSSGVAKALSVCKSNVEFRTVSLPGDHQKDTRYNSDATIEELSCYKLPHYEVVYKYDGHEYVASCFACGNINIETQVPPNDINITEVVKDKTKVSQSIQKKMWQFFTISIIAATILCLALDFAWLWPVVVFFLIMAKKRSDSYYSEYQEWSDKLSKNIAQAKVAALKSALEKHGFEPLSGEHSNALDNSSVPGATPLKPIGGRVVLSWVLTAILVIISLFTAHSVYQENLHSPDNVSLEISEKTATYDPDASPYVNGCYYVNFICDIECDNIGVEYIEMRIHVNDDDGNELGTINSSLSNIGLEADDETQMTITLKENQPENDEFFKTLYNADISDLEFEFEIGSIQFDDGDYYHNDEYNQFY